MPDLTEYTFERLDDFNPESRNLSGASSSLLARLSRSAGHLFREHWGGILVALIVMATAPFLLGLVVAILGVS